MPASFWFIFVLFSFPQQVQFHFQQYRLKKAQMVCLEFKAEAAGWQAQTKPWSHGGHPTTINILLSFFQSVCLTNYLFLYSSNNKSLLNHSSLLLSLAKTFSLSFYLSIHVCLYFSFCLLSLSLSLSHTHTHIHIHTHSLPLSLTYTHSLPLSHIHTLSPSLSFSNIHFPYFWNQIL